MTVTAKTTRTQYTGTGLVKTYAYNWKILDEADLVVVRTVAGVDTTLVLNTDYTVTGVGTDNGGNVVLTSNLASGALLTVYMAMDIEQPTDLTNQASPFLERIESAMDRQALISQQIAEELGRCIKNDPVAGSALTFADIQNEAGAAETARAGAEAAQALAESARDTAVAQVGLVEDAGATQVGLVEAEGATQIGLVQTAGATAQAWAEGTEPGGVGTKSAKEWAEEAEEASANVSSRRYLAVASVGQTTITPGFLWDDGAENVAVFIDGIKQAANTYTLASPTITLSEALVGGETIEVDSVDFTAAPSAPLYAAENLEDLADVPTARVNLGLGGAALLDVGTASGTVCAGDDARLDAAGEDTLARDNAAMNAFLAWLSASRASGPIPKGYEWTFKTDEWNKTLAAYDADGDYYANYSVQSLTHTLDTTYGGWSGTYTIVQKIPASALTVNGASVNVTFAAQPSGTLQIVDAFIGHAATSGDAYDFAATPTRLTFSGGNGVTTATGGTATSDTVTFALDETKDLLVAININSTATLKAVVTASGYATYWKTGAADAATVNKSGYTLAPSYAIACVSAITVNSAVTNMIVFGYASLGYTPTTATIYILHQAVDASTLNTDVKAASSRGSGWATANNLTTLCTFDSTYKLLRATVDLTTLATGTLGYARVETYNSKRQKVRAALAWFE